MSQPQLEALLRGGRLNRRTGVVTFPAQLRVPMAFVRGIGREPIECVLRVVRRVRSRPHNNAYWAYVITPWAKDSGDTKTGLHEALKLEILGVEASGGARLPRVRSTRGMSPEAFTDFVEQAMAIGARMGQVFEFPSGRPTVWHPPEAA